MNNPKNKIVKGQSIIMLSRNAIELIGGKSRQIVRVVALSTAFSESGSASYWLRSFDFVRGRNSTLCYVAAFFSSEYSIYSRLSPHYQVPTKRALSKLYSNI